MDAAPHGERQTDVSEPERVGRSPRRRRADALRNIDAVLSAATAVFASSGVDAPAKEITDLAGVGVGTLYRHFPQRSDLIKAVLEKEITACAEAGADLSSALDPGAALEEWLMRYTDFLATKDGLASAVHSNRAAFDALRLHILERLGPTCDTLLEGAVASGAIRTGIGSHQLLYALAKLCMPVEGESVEDSRRMVALLIDGMRFGARHDET